jgi:hypothetical protein
MIFCRRTDSHVLHSSISLRNRIAKTVLANPAVLPISSLVLLSDYSTHGDEKAEAGGLCWLSEHRWVFRFRDRRGITRGSFTNHTRPIRWY